MTFQGKRALVTGAGSGIGRAVALRLASEGATVFGHDLDEGRLKETNELAGGGLLTRTGDVSDPDECKAAVAAAVSELGGLDVLGNIAGIARGEHVTDVTVEQYRRMMGVNVDAYFFLAQAAIPHLLETGGNIVNIASNAGLMGQAYTVVYCMSKGAVVQLTKALAMELVKTPLRVNAIAPAGTMTNLVMGYQMPEDVDMDLFRYSGFRGLTEPAEIAELFAYVASDRGKSFHGAVLSIDNGVTAG
jgi:meso-butanediol dehydrogenase/(S,S)-butanediol dehydrogenase/diacetyl reductase